MRDEAQAIIKGAIAVIIDGVAQLLSAGVGVGSCVVTVVRKGHISVDRFAGLQGYGWVSVTVTISVLVPSRHACCGPVVDQGIAVIVDTITDFFRPRIDVWAGVVAVAA